MLHRSGRVSHTDLFAAHGTGDFFVEFGDVFFRVGVG